MTEPQITLQLMESMEDLELLVRGDTVRVQYHNVGFPPDIPQNAAYHGIWTLNGFLQFLIPSNFGHDYIIMYRAPKRLKIRNGIIIISEDQSVTQSFGQTDSRYKDLEITLKMSGLR